ncbi:MAG: DUF47 domain-containing protein [Anaerolineales bacterium]
MGISVFSRQKKEDKFVSLLIEQSETVVIGLRMLEKYVRTPSPEDIEEIRKKEYECDEIRRILIDELHNTFITPFDREDIFTISLHIDEMLDYALTTLEEVDLLNVKADDYLQQMVTLTRQAAEELAMAMQRLTKNPRVAGDHARRARKLENDVDHLFRLAIADLFTKAKDFKQLMKMLRTREVYRHVSNMADQASAAANVIGMVVMKLT